ncbi:MAG: hypothetical protein K0S86_5570 [Geminicoccaceae bacterium]|jgi:hypothetical protein|nr:hypothetical protein [Geminicoccaceae bacterium]
MEGDLHLRRTRHVPPDVQDWRRHVLRQAGCEEELAVRLADDGGIDLHDLLALTDRGCPPELAARIVAPL